MKNHHQLVYISWISKIQNERKTINENEKLLGWKEAFIRSKIMKELIQKTLEDYPPKEIISLFNNFIFFLFKGFLNENFIEILTKSIKYISGFKSNLEIKNNFAQIVSSLPFYIVFSPSSVDNEGDLIDWLNSKIEVASSYSHLSQSKYSFQESKNFLFFYFIFLLFFLIFFYFNFFLFFFFLLLGFKQLLMFLKELCENQKNKLNSMNSQINTYKELKVQNHSAQLQKLEERLEFVTKKKEQFLQTLRLLEKEESELINSIDKIKKKDSSSERENEVIYIFFFFYFFFFFFSHFFFFFFSPFFFWLKI